MRLIAVVIALASCPPRMHRAYLASVAAATLGAYTVDTRQTAYGLSHDSPAGGEANFLYGRHPSGAHLVAGLGVSWTLTLGLTAWMERIHSDPQAEWVKDAVLTVHFLVEGAVVAWNARVLGTDTWREW